MSFLRDVPLQSDHRSRYFLIVPSLSALILVDTGRSNQIASCTKSPYSANAYWLFSPRCLPGDNYFSVFNLTFHAPRPAPAFHFHSPRCKLPYPVKACSLLLSDESRIQNPSLPCSAFASTACHAVPDRSDLACVGWRADRWRWAVCRPAVLYIVCS